MNKLKRTRESTIFELAFLVISLAVWGYILWLMLRTQESWTSKASYISTSALLTAVAISLMVAAYFPKSINLPVKITTPLQVQLAMRLVRITAFILMLMSAVSASLFKAPSCVWAMHLLAGLMIATTVIFCFLIHKKR